MKKRSIFLLSILLFVIGCTTPSNPTTGNNPTSSVVSSNQSTQENNSSLNTSDNNSSVVVQNTYDTIGKIKEKAKDFVGLENSVGVYESNVKVELDLKLLACLDAVTTKSGYGDRYKILMSDGKDYIYLKTSYENYNYLKQYVQNQEVYKIKGNISIYNNEVEITVSEKPTYLENKILDVDYNFVEERSLAQVYEDINNLKLNCKGIAFSKLVKINAKCLAKDINNTNLYFGSEDKIINIHGHDKVTNKFVMGNSYTIVAALNVHNFRPGLEYVYSTSCEEISFKTDDIEKISAASFYSYKYETDKAEKYPNYTSFFENPYLVSGYLNSYIKDGKEYLVLEDNYNENYYSTYQNASSAKAIFFVNENYIGLTSSNSKYCPIYEHLDKGTKLDIVVFPYLWNTQKYFQVYCYSFVESN